MLYYNRQIIYLDHMEAGNKIKNAGFLKREETEDTITWNMQIKGLYETDTGFFDLRDETGAIIDKILLKRGQVLIPGSLHRMESAGAEENTMKYAGFVFVFLPGGKWWEDGREPEKY